MTRQLSQLVHILKADKNKENDRIQQMRDIVTNGFSDKGSQYSFMKHDIKLFFGDMNFRIDLPYSSVISSIDSMTHDNYDKKLNVLLNHDQLNAWKLDDEWLMGFREMPINFLPTYKYDKLSHEYDTSKKQRVPSWTDRILWYSNETDFSAKESQYIIPLFYERRESLFSDHRPVWGYFEIRCHKHNAERKLSFKNKVVKKNVRPDIRKSSEDFFENESKKEYDDFENFEFPIKSPDKEIHLDLNFNNNQKVKQSVINSASKPKSKAKEEDFIDFGNLDLDNLIDVGK